MNIAVKDFTVFRGTLFTTTLCNDWLNFLSTTGRQGITSVTLTYALSLYCIVVIESGRVFFFVGLLWRWPLYGA